jgi:hypothetical protein
MKRAVFSVFMSVVILAASPIAAQSGDGQEPVIQIAILLDTSNSMDGLINQAKSQLWRIVSETSRARRDGIMPRLEVALFEYGNDGLSIYSGYVRRVVPFTSDLDRFSRHLFELSTYGGSEYAGRAIQTAVRNLDWSRDPRSLRLMFIAGNEPFTQGNVPYHRAARDARETGIIVSTIFCGNYSEGVQTFWEDGARAGGGNYLNIDSDYVQVYIPAPQDDRLRELNEMLNETYLGYGALGEAREMEQAAQDDNAADMGMGSYLDRASVKSSPSYSNAEWDLVDAYADGVLSIEEIPAEQLPSELQGMDDDEREEYVSQVLQQRTEIQAEIQRLSAEREEYLDAERAALENEQTLDYAIIETLRDLGTRQGFVFD